MSAAVLSRIPGLCERQLRGWCRAVFEWRIREPFPGEVAALFDRAKALGIREDSLPLGRGSATKEAGPKALPTPTTPDHNRTCTRGATMAVDSQYNDSACADNPPKCDTWQPVGAVAARVVAKAVAK